MVPVSHALDLKASNPKTSVAPTAPAKTGFQALIDRLAHHLEAEKPVKVSLDKPKPEAAHAERKTEKVVSKHEAEKSEKVADKSEKRDDANSGANANVLAIAALVLKPDAPRPSEAQAASIQVKPLKDRDLKAPAPADSPPQQGLKPVLAFKHLDHVPGTEEKPKVTVIDRRTDKEKEKAKTESAMAQGQAQPQAPLPAPEAAAKSDATMSVAEAKVVFHPTDQGTPFDIKPQNAVPAARDAATFQQFLVDKGYGQLVDQARIVLRDNNAGEIRMTLHPESLGKVKVALNLSDGSLAGQIFVENQTVKDVFQSNMDGLLQAFRDGGWTDLSLQVSVGGEQKRNSESAPAPARDYGRQVTAVSNETPEAVRIGAWTDRQINLTA